MVKKLFAVASLTALTGLVVSVAAAGCSSSSSSGDTSTDAGDSGKKETGVVPDTDSGDTDGGGGTCPSTDPITSADIDSQIGWKPPAAIQNVCNAADIQKLNDNFQAGTAKTFNDLVAGITGTCHDCIIGPKENANWGPIVTFDAQGQTGIVNFGACFGIYDSPACGKANEYLELCLNVACQDCDQTNDTVVQACISKAIKSGGACYGILGETQSSCTKQDAQDKCGSIIDGASILCAGGVYDGGTIDGGM